MVIVIARSAPRERKNSLDACRHSISSPVLDKNHPSNGITKEHFLILIVSHPNVISTQYGSAFIKLQVNNVIVPEVMPIARAEGNFINSFFQISFLSINV